MMPSRRPWGPALWGGVGAALVLLAVYLLTLAPDVTLWDSGELIAAIHTLGIPHPPGTPLFVLVGRAWTLLLTPLGVAQAANLLSAVATAAACGLLASRVARWSGSGVAALAAGITAGAGSTVWRNATETEVYALALLLAAVTLVMADRAGREDDGRWTVLVAYLLALAVPLHLFALVASPGAIVLAATDTAGRPRWGRALGLAAVVAGIVAVGTGRPAGLAVALVAAAASTAYSHRHWRAAGNRRAAGVAWLLAAAAMGLSVIVVLVVRARFDPFLNEGNPASLAALGDVLARRQYSVAAPWPRQAPFWLQLGNVLQYADWQFALGLAPGPAPAWGRTSVTALFALLGLWGAAEHRRRDRRSWRAMVVLMLAATVAVVVHLNLRAGPSFGYGVLPEGALREARERDYFFVFAFWLWGAWAGMGAMAAARALVARALVARALVARALVGRAAGRRRDDTAARAAIVAVGLLLAAAPVALNWSAVDRRSGPDSTIALDAGLALLDAVPAGAVLLTAGDLDSYPIWYLQAIHGARPDVTVVIVPMLPAGWYRAELARRQGLLPPPDGGPWSGEDATIGLIAEAARQRSRPLAASALLGARERRAAGDDWVPAGVVHLLREVAEPDSTAGEGPGSRPPAGASSWDGATAARTAILVRRQVADGRRLPPSTDPAARRMRSLLACAPLVAAGATGTLDGDRRSLLASWCNLP